MGTYRPLPQPAPIAQPAPMPSPIEQFARLMQVGNQVQQQQAGQLELQQQQQAMKDQQAFRQAMTDPANQGKTIGEVADTLANGGNISMQGWQQMKKTDIDQRTALATLDEKSLANAKAAHQQTQELYNNAMDMPDDQLAQNWPAIARQYDAIPGNMKTPLNPSQPMSKQQLQQFGPMLSMQNAYFDEELKRRQAITEAQTAQATLAQKQAESQFYQQNGGAPGVPAEMMQQADWLKKNPGKGPSDYKLWTLQHTPAATVMGNMFGANDPGLDLAAQNYRETGQMPAGLARSPGSTKAIIDRAAQLDQAAGGQGIAANKSILQANSDSLKKLQTNFDQVQAFENTAGKNIDLFLDKLSGITDLGAKFGNVPLRMINDKMIGTDAYQAMKAAQQTAASESAKVLSSANASGVLSDTQKKDAEDMLSGNLSLSAAKQVAATLKQDFANRHQSYQAQIQDIQNRLKRGGSSGDSSDEGQRSQPSQPMTITLPSGKTLTIQ